MYLDHIMYYYCVRSHSAAAAGDTGRQIEVHSGYFSCSVTVLCICYFFVFQTCDLVEDCQGKLFKISITLTWEADKMCHCINHYWTTRKLCETELLRFPLNCREINLTSDMYRRRYSS